MKVEYAKSGRSKCTWKKCSQFIDKGELRIGTGSQMPGVDEISYKWRHLCCFSNIQIKNLGSVDHIDGYDECLPEHQEALRRMMKGEYIEQYTKIRGKYIHPTIATATAAQLTAMGKKNKNVGGGVGGQLLAPVVGVKRARATTAGGASKGPTVTLAGAYVDTGVESDATDDYEVEISKGRPQCPFGSACFRKDPDHFTKFAHHGDNDDESSNSNHNQTKKGPSDLKVISYSPGSGGQSSGALSPATATSYPHQPHQQQQQHLAAPPPTTAAVPGDSAATGAYPKQLNYFDGGGAKSPCPFGMMCLRTDPKHRAEFAH